MLYSNVSAKSEKRVFDYGSIFQVALGEHGSGRRLLVLTCPEGTAILEGMNESLSIGLTRSGRPRINATKDDDTLYMLLSSQGGYTRRGNGTIQVPATTKEEYELLAKGWGADGMAGRIGRWDVVLIKVPQNGIVKVRKGGGGYGTPADLYVIKEGKVYRTTLEELEDCCEMLRMDIPCKIQKEEGRLQFGDDWTIL